MPNSCCASAAWITGHSAANVLGAGSVDCGTGAGGAGIGDGTLAALDIEPYRSSPSDFTPPVDDGTLIGVAPPKEGPDPLAAFASSVVADDGAGGVSESGVTVGGAIGGLLGAVAALLAAGVVGSGGKSGIFGTSGKLSDSGVIADDELLLLCESTFNGPPASGGGTGQVFAPSVSDHFGAASPEELAALFHAGLGVSDAGPLGAPPVIGAVSGGTPDALCAESFASSTRWAGFSLIFVYRNTPAAIRIEIVISGRIEFIVRPP